MVTWKYGWAVGEDITKVCLARILSAIDLTPSWQENAFDEAVKDVVAIDHTASPVKPPSDDPNGTGLRLTNIVNFVPTCGLNTGLRISWNVCLYAWLDEWIGIRQVVVLFRCTCIDLCYSRHIFGHQTEIEIQSFQLNCKNVDRLMNCPTAPMFGCKQLFLLRPVMTPPQYPFFEVGIQQKHYIISNGDHIDPCNRRDNRLI